MTIHGDIFNIDNEHYKVIAILTPDINNVEGKTYELSPQVDLEGGHLYLTDRELQKYEDITDEVSPEMYLVQYTFELANMAQEIKREDLSPEELEKKIQRMNKYFRKARDMQKEIEQSYE